MKIKARIRSSVMRGTGSPGGLRNSRRSRRDLGLSAPSAVVLGDIDLVRPLTRAGVRCAVFAPPEDPVRFSRHAAERLPYADPWRQPEAVVEAIEAYAGRQSERPVLVPQGDGELLLLSRHRDRLAQSCSLVLASPELVEDLVDKARFLELAKRRELPVPRSRRVAPMSADVGEIELRLPLIVKPVLRDPALWRLVGGPGKGIHIGDVDDLHRLWCRVRELGDVEILLQEAVPGPETKVESYHTYVDGDGRIVAEFTGRKIRTSPAEYGHSTAVEITAAPDVTALGRTVVERLGLTGVAKADFKRAPDGSLHLLEVNPRFTLWHNPAAVAGVNIPALVYADATGRPRAPIRPARPGVTWCHPLSDLLAVVKQGQSVTEWLRFFMAADSRYGLTLDDPFPLLPGAFLRAANRRIHERLHPG